MTADELARRIKRLDEQIEANVSAIETIRLANGDLRGTRDLLVKEFVAQAQAILEQEPTK